MSLPPRSIVEARWGVPEDVEREAQKWTDAALFETHQLIGLRAAGWKFTAVAERTYPATCGVIFRVSVFWVHRRKTDRNRRLLAASYHAPPLATILFKNVTGTPVADDELTEQVDDGLDAAINQGTQILLDRGWNAKR